MNLLLLSGGSSPTPAATATRLPLASLRLLCGGSSQVIADTLVEAVVARINANLVGAGVLTWFGSSKSPGASTAALPYAVLHEPDEDDDPLNTEGDMTADGHLEIHAYASTDVAAKALGKAIAGQLNDAPLVFEEGTLTFLRQANRSLDIDPDPAPGGGDCWDELRMFHFIYAYAINSN